MYGIPSPQADRAPKLTVPRSNVTGLKLTPQALQALRYHSPQHCHVRHTSHVLTWLDSNLPADWTSARGTLCSCFPETIAFSTADLRIHRACLVSTFLSPRILLTSAFKMDVPEPDQSPFTAVTAHTSKLTRVSLDCRLRGCDQRNASPPFLVCRDWVDPETLC
jgi:hypothetical protein